MVDRIFLITGYAATSPAQEFLQIEVQNDPETIKYGLGKKIVIKTKQNDEWQAIVLCKFIYETGTILYDQGMLQVEDIVAIREIRPV